MTSLRRLQQFAMAAETLNLHRAAERLGIRQPSLSSSIAELERELGVDLFIRDNQRLVGLTPAGELFLAHVRHALAELEEARRAARDIAEGHGGLLRIGVCEEATTLRLAAVLRAWRPRFPRVRLGVVELSSVAQVEALRANLIDIGFLVAPGAATGIAVEAVWEESWLVALPEAHPLAAVPIIEPGDLAGVDLVMSNSGAGSARRDELCGFLAAASVLPRVVAHVGHRSALRLLVAGGIGVAVMPASLEPVVIPGIVVRPLAAPGITISAAYRAAESHGAAMQLLRLAKDPPRLAEATELPAAKLRATRAPNRAGLSRALLRQPP